MLLINFSVQVFIYVFEKRIWILIHTAFIVTITLISYYMVFNNKLPIIYLCYIYAIASGMLLFINILIVIKLIWIRNVSFTTFINVILILFPSRFREFVFQSKAFLIHLLYSKKPLKFAFIFKEVNKNNISKWRNGYSHSFNFYSINEISQIKPHENIAITSSNQFENLIKSDLLNAKQILIPKIDTYYLCLNKWDFLSFFKNTALEKHFPKTENISFPIVVKKKLDEPNSNTYFVDNKAELEKYSDLLASEEYFSQEYIKGNKEYSFHSVMINGKIEAFHCMEFVFDTEFPINYKSNLLYKRKIDIDKDKVILFEKILAQIDYSGISCLDFKIYQNQIYIFELNPRMGYNLQPYFQSFIENIKQHLIQ